MHQMGHRKNSFEKLLGIHGPILTMTTENDELFCVDACIIPNVTRSFGGNGDKMN